MLSIRKADKSELPYVLELLAAMDGKAELALEHALRVFREMERYRDYACYLAWDGARPVGTFTLMVFPTLVHDGAFEALVDGVVVAPTRRGEGIGGAMMSEAMRLAAQAGCYKLMLSSNAKRDDAHRFYRSLGFRQHGVCFWIDIAPLGDLHRLGAAPENA